MRILLFACHNSKGPSNPVGGGLEPVLDYFNDRDDVQNWLVLFNQVVLLQTSADIDSLTRAITRRFPYILFLLTEINSALCNGKLPREAWTFVEQSSNHEDMPFSQQLKP